jgi:hypothetical protein
LCPNGRRRRENYQSERDDADSRGQWSVFASSIESTSARSGTSLDSIVPVS